MGQAATLLMVGTQTLLGQVPSKIPSDTEAQIFNLIKRVTALEEKLAALTNGSASLRVRAPFIVTDAAGDPVLQVTNGPQPLGKEGVVIARDPGSDIGGVALYDGAGQDMVTLVQLPGKGGGLVLTDGNGIQRVELAGDGRFALADEQGKDYVTIAGDISEVESSIRIGGDEDRYSVQVGSNEGMAILGVGEDGVGVLSLSDAEDRERASLEGDGVLHISDEAGRDVLSVSNELSEFTAGVAITMDGDAGLIRVTDAAGKPAAGIMGGKRAVVVVNQTGKVLAEMLATPTAEGMFQSWGEGKLPLAVLGRGPGNGGIVQITNGQTPVSTLMSGESGAGRLQLNDNNGTPVVEAGVLTSGKGVVRVGPKYRCGSNTGLALGVVGGAATGMLPPDCIVGVTN
jgi:hypothetical protein